MPHLLRQQIQAYGQKHGLTEREIEILQLLVQRIVLPAKIAKTLNISVNTVNNHMKKLFAKTNTDNKAELLASVLLFLNEDRGEKKNSWARKPNVMILDDEGDFCETLADYLQTKEIQTICITDPQTALEECRKLKIDVIISDIRMPKMNGLQFLQEIRKGHYYEPGVIFVSGYAAEQKAETLLDKGAFAFLEKPVDFEKIYRLIHSYILETSNTESPVEIENLTIKLENGIVLNPENVGFGGFFLDYNDGGDPKRLENLKTGDKITLGFQLGSTENETHSAVCEVAWNRPVDEGSLRKGVGLRFVKLEPDARQEIFEYVRTRKILSFIPIGEKI